jgi:branched-chain amino acid transport system permease protein
MPWNDALKTRWAGASLALAAVSACAWLLWRIRRSPFGMVLGAIRENRQRAIYTGLDVRALELRLFVIAGAFAGVAGALRAPLQQMAFPSLLHWSQSAEPVLVTLAGGMGSFFGPAVGAAVFVFTNFAITSRFEYPLLVFGSFVLAIVLFLPQGVVGGVQALLRLAEQRRSGRKPCCSWRRAGSRRFSAAFARWVRWTCKFAGATSTA